MACCCECGTRLCRSRLRGFGVWERRYLSVCGKKKGGGGNWNWNAGAVWQPQPWHHALPTLQVVHAASIEDRDSIVEYSKAMGFLTDDDSRAMIDAHVAAVSGAESCVCMCLCVCVCVGVGGGRVQQSHRPPVLP